MPRLDAKVVALGEKLFHDKRLSVDGTIACASCHIIAEGGDDNLPRSRGVSGREGGVNAPTVLNAALNFVLFWDGRAPTLEDQAGGPLVNEKEMATTWAHVLSLLGADPQYLALFKQAFPDGVTEKNVRTSIATFERTLLTPGARFDRWLEGDKAALSEEEVAGYALFKSVGCIACHQGQNVGGNMFQKFGVLGDYFKERGNITRDDYGRFNVTGLESDRFVFRVPSLRNVELTAPYFHDGSAATLEQAVRTMARYQLGRPLEDADVGRLVAFLKTLTAPVPGKAAP
jgi:cytochrome c peroxidase